MVAERFGQLPWSPQMLELTVDQLCEGAAWMELRARWEKEAYEKARREAEQRRR